MQERRLISMDVIQSTIPAVHPPPLHNIGIRLLIPDKGIMHTAHLMQRVFRGVLAGRDSRKTAAGVGDFATEVPGDGRTPVLRITPDSFSWLQRSEELVCLLQRVRALPPAERGCERLSIEWTAAAAAVRWRM